MLFTATKIYYLLCFCCTNIKGGMIIWKIVGCIDWEILKIYNLKTIHFFHFLTKIKGGTHQSAEILKVFYQSLETTKSYLDRKFLCGIFRTNWLTDWRTDEFKSIAMGMVGKKDIDYQWVKMNQWVKKCSKKKLGSIYKGWTSSNSIAMGMEG